MFYIYFFVIITFTNATYLYFEHDSYDIELSEATQVFSQITSIKARSSAFLSVQYKLHSDTNNTFYLDSLTAELILLKLLDYETISLYKLTIEAYSISTVAPCFTELIIHVLDVNDNVPEMNLIIYPTVLYEKTIIKYDLNQTSTSFATIIIKDNDKSTTNLTLSINDTKHFQLDLIRHMKRNVIYLLSTRNNSLFMSQNIYFVSLYACDNDQPTLCSNQTYKFVFKSNDYLCFLSFKQKQYIIDINETHNNIIFHMNQLKNQYCEYVYYSIDNQINFYINSSTGDLYSLKAFDRNKQSIYSVNISMNFSFNIQILIRILDQYNRIPFLFEKSQIVARKNFQFINLYNSSLCQSKEKINNYFQLFSNCTLAPIMIPPIGQYLFQIELDQNPNYQDTFSLELVDNQIQQILSMKVVIIISSILLISGIMIGIIILFVKHKTYGLKILCPIKQKMSSLTNIRNGIDKSLYNTYDAPSKISQLQVHDDYEVSPSKLNSTNDIIGKSSPPISSLSLIRDDEGYSGSSDLSDKHLSFQSMILSPSQLNERFCLHDGQNQLSNPTIYDVPRKSDEKMSLSLV